MGNSEILKTLFDKYGLYYDGSNPDSKENDVYVHKHYKIITRGGIQKIEKAAGIQCDMEVVAAVSEPNNVTMKGVGTMIGENGLIKTYTTFASASELTSQNKYYAEMAEKRCRSRLVLTLAGLYELGVFGEDEADNFSSVVRDQKAQNSYSKVTYKGNG